MLCYVAFSCASYTTTSYVKISLPTWKVGKETQPWLKSTWSKVNNLGNTVFFRPGINFHVSTQWNWEIQSLKPCNLYIWNGTCAQRGKNTNCCKCLRNDSGDTWQNSQRHRDRYSRRDLVFATKLAAFFGPKSIQKHASESGIFFARQRRLKRMSRYMFVGMYFIQTYSI